MRIGIDARFLGAANSSLARYSESLIQALARRDTKNDYVVYVHANLKRRLRIGDNFHLTPLRGNPLSLRSMLRIAHRVRHDNLDALHVHFPIAPPRVSCPILLTVHDMFPFERHHGDFGPRRAHLRWLWSYLIHPWSLRSAKWILCVSNSTRRQLIQAFPEMRHQSIVMHSGVHEAFRAPVEPATLDLIRSRLKLPENYLLYSGSTRADKNLVGMLRAFALLRQRSPQHKSLHFILEISGDPVGLQSLRRLIHQYELDEWVRIAQNVVDEERRVLFADARALFQISRGEGFCFPALEAQECGVPVVAADAGAVPEIAGEAALLVDPDDQEAIVAMVERLLGDEDLRNYLIAKGKANVKRFDWANAAAQSIQIYELLSHSTA